MPPRQDHAWIGLAWIHEIPLTRWSAGRLEANQTYVALHLEPPSATQEHFTAISRVGYSSVTQDAIGIDRDSQRM